MIQNCHCASSTNWVESMFLCKSSNILSVDIVAWNGEQYEFAIETYLKKNSDYNFGIGQNERVSDCKNILL